MADIYDINGNPIDVSTIKEQRVQEFDYIFRPVFHETVTTSFGGLRRKRSFQFVNMEPYAYVLSANGRKTALAQYKPTNIGDAVIKDIGAFFNDIVEGVAGFLNIKGMKDPKYVCVRGSQGEPFETYLHDSPARVYDLDGRPFDCYQHDELYHQLGQSVSPIREMVPALTITTTTGSRYVFFGSGINVPDAVEESRSLTAFIQGVEEQKRLVAEQKKAAQRPLISIPKIELPKVELPKIDLPKIDISKVIPQVKITFPSQQTDKQKSLPPEDDGHK